MPSPRLRKDLSQHFLTNEHIKQKIINSCQLSSSDIVLEIGPGLGAITEHVIPQVRKVYAIETDERFFQQLEERFRTLKDKISILHADFLKEDLSKYPPGLKVIGNLPYHISTPILEKLVQHRERIKEIFITVQWEFGKRLTAQPHSKAYGALSCFIQYYFLPKILFPISPGCFSPAPKVHSCFMHLKGRSPSHLALNENELFRIIQTAFSQRRKKIVNALSNCYPKTALEEYFHLVGINPQARAENLSLENFIDLSNRLVPVKREGGGEEPR